MAQRLRQYILYHTSWFVTKLMKKKMWKMYIDDASNALKHMILIFLKENYFLFTVRLNFDYTNNVIEYEACIIGVQIVIKKRWKDLKYMENLLWSSIN